MASTSQKWLIGCGVGCGVMILAFALLGAGGFFLIKNIVRDVQQTEAVMESVTAQYGSVREYRPAADGTITPRRLESFLMVRDLMAPQRTEMENSLALLTEMEDRRWSVSPLKIVKAIRTGLGLLPGIFDYLTRRNEALLEAGMGLGEYTYIYAVVYYSWLGKSPADGPPFVLMGHGDEEDEDLDEFEVRDRRREGTLRYLNRQLLAMLRHQQADLAEEIAEGEAAWAEGGWGADRDAWRQTLAAEIAALESDFYRLAWSDGLPENLTASLRPYRERLAASYSFMCNPLEMGVREGF